MFSVLLTLFSLPLVCVVDIIKCHWSNFTIDYCTLHHLDGCPSSGGYTITGQLGQFSLASLRCRLIEYHAVSPGVKAGMLPLCDPVCHASSRSGVAMLHCELLYTHVVYFTDFFHRWTRVGLIHHLRWVGSDFCGKILPQYTPFVVCSRTALVVTIVQSVVSVRPFVSTSFFEPSDRWPWFLRVHGSLP